jgi:hypothetical protein
MNYEEVFYPLAKFVETIEVKGQKTFSVKFLQPTGKMTFKWSMSPSEPAWSKEWMKEREEGILEILDIIEKKYPGLSIDVNRHNSRPEKNPDGIISSWVNFTVDLNNPGLLNTMRGSITSHDIGIL